MQMSVRERILTIRLMEKAKENPTYAAALGVTTIDPPGLPTQQGSLKSEKQPLNK
jgi:hypothetical protein